MKVTPRFMVRAALGLTAAGVIGAFGACNKDGGPIEPPPPPPGGQGIVAPSGLTATAVSQTRVDLAWTDNANNETGFRVERCTGDGCSNFAQIGSNLEANVVAFVDTFGLTADTKYEYRVAAFNATETSTFAAGEATTLKPDVPPPSNQFTLLTVGEIMTCQSTAGPDGTARIVNEIMSADTSAIVVTAGDNLSGTDGAATYQDCFDPKPWGQLKSRARFAIGNGDFDGARDAADIYSYFGDRTGPAGKGWFSFDKGNWHIVVLNTSDREHGTGATFGIIDGDPATPGFQESRVPSEQVDWLTADLAANTKPCVAVISWERRLFTSGIGTLGKNTDMKPMVQLMYQNGVDVLISAKDHVYERFPQTNTDGVVDTEKGFRQFIVGTGGTTPWSIKTPNPNPPAGSVTSNVESQGNAWGVLKLTLGAASYKWEFLPTIAGGFTDTGETACH